MFCNFSHLLGHLFVHNYCSLTDYRKHNLFEFVNKLKRKVCVLIVSGNLEVVEQREKENKPLKRKEYVKKKLRFSTNFCWILSFLFYFYAYLFIIFLILVLFFVFRNFFFLFYFWGKICSLKSQWMLPFSKTKKKKFCSFFRSFVLYFFFHIQT